MEPWLRSLRLEQYAFKMSGAGFHTLEDCARITEPDLINMDIVPGHRKRILMNKPVPSAPASHLSDDEAIYQNVAYPSPNASAVYDVPAPTVDDTYDVPVPRPRTSELSQKSDGDTDSDEEYYVNVPDLLAQKKLPSPSPPSLPPKKRDSNRDSTLDEMFGIMPQMHLEPGVKKPVPAPRSAVRHNVNPAIKDSQAHLGVSLDSALDNNIGSAPEAMHRPIPKPRKGKLKSSSSTTSIRVEEQPTIEEVVEDEPEISNRKSLSDQSSLTGSNLMESYSSPRSSGSYKDLGHDPEVMSAIGTLDNVLDGMDSLEDGSDQRQGDYEDFGDDYASLKIPNGGFKNAPMSGIPDWDCDIYEPVGEPDILIETPLSLASINRDENANTTNPTDLKSLDSDPGYGLVWGGPGMKHAMEDGLGETTSDAGIIAPTTPQVFIPRPFITWDEISHPSRESTLSFNEPPPCFTPPPLPDNISLPDSSHQPGFKKISPGPPMLRPLSTAAPPTIPPRPKMYTPPAKGTTSKPESPAFVQPPATSKSGPSLVPTPLAPTSGDGLLAESEAVPYYDTPAEAKTNSSVIDYSDGEYSEVAPSLLRSHPPLPRESTMSFSDFAVHRLGQSSSDVSEAIALNTSTQSEPEKPWRPQQPTTPQRSISQVSEENIYVDEPVSARSPKSPSDHPVHPAAPPSPPPRSSKPPKELFTHPELEETTTVGAIGGRPLCDLESDDTLSDGGEFLEDDIRHLRPSVLPNSIPIVPATPATLKERKGYLHKLPSRHHQKRVGWKKRWVKFDGEELSYFSSEKSMISKRIIPISTIRNVEQQIKTNDLHPYEFRLITQDRIYRFAAEDGDDLAMWTSILMRAILDTKTDEFEEGGPMARPDKEGFVRMEGLKGRQYLVIKKDKFCYYNTFSDYKVATPIHRVDLQLASVKDLGKGKLQLLTPHVTFGLLCESDAEQLSWKEAFEEGIADGLGDDTTAMKFDATKILKEVYENHSNKLCADCGAPDPHWASINFGITLCKQCAGIHRMLNAPVSKVRSLRMDFKVWTPSLIKLLHTIGNDNSNLFWEWTTTEDDRIDSDADMSSRQEYVLAKYRNRRFIHLHPFHFDQTALNEALCKSVQYGNVLETLQALFSGADIQCVSSMYGSQNETPLQLAKRSRQTLQLEFLIQNGAEVAGKGLHDRQSMAFQQSYSASGASMKGYLLKQQANQREYQRRWFTLERGVLSYYENERSTVAKDSLERKEIMSVAASSNERYEYGFELSTTKAGGRVYILAAETPEDRHQWIVKIAKSFAPLPTDLIDKIKDIDRGGIVFLRERATATDWRMTWIQTKAKNLYIFKKDEQIFEEVDLRMVTGITEVNKGGAQAPHADACIETFDDGPPFVITLPNRALYIQGDMRRETEAWFSLLQKASTENTGYLNDFQLTSDHVPVIVEKCINFISAHGLRLEGIYRLSGQHSKVGQLLEEFKLNAHNVVLSLDLYTVHDVATALKRLFRTLKEPLLASALFQKWIETTHITDWGAKMQWYKYLLGELPFVHYATLKKLVVHIAQIASLEAVNKMSDVNLASIFGPILMRVDVEESLQAGGYGSTTQEISVVRDIVANHKKLFEIKDIELEHERKIQEAMAKIVQASRASQGDLESAQAGDLLLGFYLRSRDSNSVITMKVPATMTSQEVLAFIMQKADLDTSLHWSIYEVICQEQMERPLQYKERVLDVSLRWSDWSEEFSRDNYFLVKPNVVYEKVNLVFDPQFTLFNELKFSDKKAFKKFYFEFSQCKLSYQKDTRAANPIGSWNVEDLVLYIGVESKRSPPTKWCITFLPTGDKQTKTKDHPFFGYTLSCQDEKEMYRWLAAMLHAQHPEGLVPEGVILGPATNEPILPVPVEGAIAGSRESSPKVKKSSFLQRLKYPRR